MIAILTKDLMMSSSASAAAKSKGLVVKTVPSFDALKELLGTNPVSLVLVDLQMPGLDFIAAANGMSQIAEADRPHVLAYAQHVNVELIEQATTAGFEVVTRGQLNAGLGELMAQYCA